MGGAKMSFFDVAPDKMKMMKRAHRPGACYEYQISFILSRQVK